MSQEELLKQYQRLFKVLDPHLVNDEYYEMKGNTYTNSDLISSIIENIKSLEENKNERF